MGDACSVESFLFILSLFASPFDITRAGKMSNEEISTVPVPACLRESHTRSEGREKRRVREERETDPGLPSLDCPNPLLIIYLYHDRPSEPP